MKEGLASTTPSSTELAIEGNVMGQRVFLVLKNNTRFTEALFGEEQSEVVFDPFSNITEKATVFLSRDERRYAFFEEWSFDPSDKTGYSRFLLVVVSPMPGSKRFKADEGVMVERVEISDEMTGSLKFLSDGKIETDNREALEGSKRFIEDSIRSFQKTGSGVTATSTD